MRKGYKIKCISNKGAEGKLTLNKIYSLISNLDGVYYNIVDDRGEDVLVFFTFFKPIEYHISYLNPIPIIERKIEYLINT
jgi:hypothetical protein